MKVIDFLPNDYLAKKSRRRANLACLAIAGGVSLVVGAALVLLTVDARSTARLRELVDQQYQEASQQVDQLKQLEEKRADLMRKVSLSTTLLERVPRSNVLARVTNHLPPGTSLVSLTMKMEEVEVRAPSSASAADKEAAAKKGKPETVKIKQYVFRLDGVAPTDVEVATLINQLNRDPLFQNTVDLLFSEEAPGKAGASVRRFQLVFRLIPDAEKVLETAPMDVAAALATAQVRGDS
jgi:Tfp pilus assembly protein PilN